MGLLLRESRTPCGDCGGNLVYQLGRTLAVLLADRAVFGLQRAQFLNRCNQLVPRLILQCSGGIVHAGG
ncbi:MAG: hypothetical protein V9G09_02860 [Candidatus Nanopelagicales bacterium]